MPLGLGWENPDPDASLGIGGDDEATAAQQASAAPAAAAPESAPARTAASSPSRKGSGKKSGGTRSDGRKTSTTKGGSSKNSKKKSAKSEKNSSGRRKSRHAESSSSGDADRPEPAAVPAAAAAAMDGPEAAEDDAPSPHKSASRRHQSGRASSSSGNRHRSSGERSRSSAKQPSSSSGSRRTKSGTRTGSGKSGRPSGSPRASPRSSPRASPRSSPNRDRNGTNNNNTSMDSAVAAVAAAAAAAGSSPTDTNETRETSYDSWRENGSNEDVDDIEAGGAASPRSASSPAKRSYKDKSSSGRGGSAGRGSRSKSAGKNSSRSKSSSGGKKGSSSSRRHGRSGRSSSNHRNHRSRSGNGRSSSRRHTSRSRRKYDYVSCFGWEWKKTHLLFLAVALILLTGGAVAALLFTGILGTGGSSSKASDFSSVTNSPTAAPTTDDFGMSSGDGSRPTPRPTMRSNGGSPAASDQNQPAPAPRPTGTPMPTSCTETTDLFKYFDDSGAVITTNCKKVALSTESDDVKCQRTVVFGGGYSVRDMCPITCGGCLFKQGNGDGPMLTDKPTAFTLEPTPAPKPVAVPTFDTASNGGASPNGEFDGHETFSFYVMGDIPYMYKQDLTLIEQLKDQTDTLDPKEEIFQVHVGDIQNPKRTQCASSHFDKIAGYFKTYSKLPNLILPGDNDWNDCPNPDLAWQYWQSNFVPFEQYWSDSSDFPSTVMRQSGQRENFAFQRGGVLFLGLNLVGGQTNEYVTEEDWDQKIDNDIAWAKFHMDRLNVGSPRADPADKDYIRAVIIFGHSPRGRRFNNFLMQRLYNSNLPIVYLHGNGHTYQAVQPFLSDGWTNYWRIQVDQGFNAPPAKVTVRGTTREALRTSMAINGGKIFPGGFIKLDRRGGLYEGAVATDADGNPLISGVGG